jgi:heme a synthase
MLIQLAIIALLAALLPLALAWAAGDASRYRKLTWLTLFLTFDLILFGAFTRLTDSGLGCPDWPGCYGHANPLQAHASIAEAQALLPDGPVTVAKAWIEMLHRYLAMTVGVLIIALVALAWRQWLRSGKAPPAASPWLPSALLLMVCLQGAFGAWTVTYKLQPLIVTTHLLLGLTLLALLTRLAARQDPPSTAAASAGRRPPVRLVLALLTLQIALGGWVSTNYAALACTDFPLCQGALLPPMDFSHGFALWRELGKTAGGDYLPFPALTAIHWLHRSFALVVFALIGWLALRTRHIDGVQRITRWLLIVLGTQFLTGVSAIFLAWPLPLAIAHNGGAALLVVLLAMLDYKIGFAAPLPLHLRPLTT